MESKIKFKPNRKYRLMDQVREVLRYYLYSYKTEHSYSFWILQYIKILCRLNDSSPIIQLDTKRAFR